MARNRNIWSVAVFTENGEDITDNLTKAAAYKLARETQGKHAFIIFRDSIKVLTDDGEYVNWYDARGDEIIDSAQYYEPQYVRLER